MRFLRSLFLWIVVFFVTIFYILKLLWTKDVLLIKKWAKLVCFIFGVKVEKRGQIASRCVCMANHESYFDIMAMETVIQDRCIWIAKQELFKNPVLGMAMKNLDVIPVKRSTTKNNAISLLKAIKKRKGIFMIFPEGSRIKEKKVFSKGGIFLAQKLNLPIIPTKIEGTREIMPPGTIVVRKGKVIVHFKEKIMPQGNIDEIAERVHEEIR